MVIHFFCTTQISLFILFLFFVAWFFQGSGPGSNVQPAGCSAIFFGRLSRFNGRPVATVPVYTYCTVYSAVYFFG